MTPNKPQPRDELNAIERQRLWIALTSALALVVLAAALFQAPPTAVIVVGLLISVALKKAAVKYRALGARRAVFLHELNPKGPPQEAPSPDT